ncbi:hypothetical protein [Streptomyces barringtoniae]|uniref:hypothetical protein n=1 Tax=Streptomyces barringtoniae TaxID=2892029 RepID=UPI003555D4DF
MSTESATGLPHGAAGAGDPRITVAVITRDRPASLLMPALRRTGHLMRTVPRDIASARAFAQATAGLPWVLRRRDPVPPDLERRPAALERARRTSPARRYVG